ncbi:hypothetical protein HMPREF9439_02073 [Parasutterella excrementihominis YIT 11859]|uniref:Uncharacterized protein n=1 Tax=Parasutterella excrementihominis YIT 11859 TaxID=762966 RepID=F3QM96_9BURK|nr:hypothetical protein HMPREF9439_02073 [Parasutterella excrementihominis YIT 11859]
MFVNRCKKHIGYTCLSWRSRFSHQIGLRAGICRKGLATDQKIEAVI